MSGADVSRHRYPGRAMRADYLRAGVGMALTLGPLAYVNAAPVMVYIFGGLGTLFLVFGARTFLRHLTRVDVDAETIRTGRPFRAELRWRDLNGMTLRYYSTQRDRRGGWMQLRLTGGRRALRFDSTIDGFPVIARRAFAAARTNRLELNETTLANLASLGVIFDETTTFDETTAGGR